MPIISKSARTQLRIGGQRRYGSFSGKAGAGSGRDGNEPIGPGFLIFFTEGENDAAAGGGRAQVFAGREELFKGLPEREDELIILLAGLAEAGP